MGAGPLDTLPTSPLLSATGSSHPQFQPMMMGLSVVMGLMHTALLALFYFHGVTTLVLINLACVLLHGVTFFLAMGKRATWSWALTMIGLVAHAVLAVCLIGWDSGFHLYIMLVPPVIVVSAMDNLRGKAPVVLGLMGLYVWLDLTQREVPATYALEPLLLNGLYYFNLLTVLVVLVCLAALYYRLVLLSEHQLREMATTDPLTRLRNRRSVLETAWSEAARQHRDGRPLSFILCDIDHFKLVNDQHGHDAGDEVIKAVAEVLRSEVREVDHAARWGGEEFLLVLPETALAGAALVAHRLREKVAALTVPGKTGPLSISMTFGVSALRLDESIEQAIARADQALYQGKNAGRNRVDVAADPAPLLQPVQGGG